MFLGLTIDFYENLFSLKCYKYTNMYLGNLLCMQIWYVHQEEIYKAYYEWRPLVKTIQLGRRHEITLAGETTKPISS